MHLRLFWRVILAQSTLIALLLIISAYALSQLTWLTNLNTDIFVVDMPCIEHEKRLLQIFLAQMRNAEKYVLLRDRAFYERFMQDSGDFEYTREQIAAVINTDQERALLEQIKTLQARYVASLTTALSRPSRWFQERTDLSDGITTGLSDLIRFREELVAQKTAAAREQVSVATRVLGWLTPGGIILAIILSYFHAHNISQPLRKLTRELRRVGTGDFHRSLKKIRGPKEVDELSQAFNWMSTRLAELDRMKTDFMAHMSHELRTPLTAIQEGTALLLEDATASIIPSQREILEVVRSYSERLSYSISSVLDLTKMEAGMMEYVQRPSDVTVLLEQSLQNIRLLAQKKGLYLEVICAPSLPLLLVDESRILQVFNNLLSNAVKFTPPSGKIIIATLLCHDGEDQQSWLEVRITDTGVGIPAEEVERIFDRFYQSAYHQKHNQQGTGLGLAIARHIVEAHGGKMWVESRIGEGSTFICRLPIADNEAEKLALLAQQSGVHHAA